MQLALRHPESHFLLQTYDTLVAMIANDMISTTYWVTGVDVGAPFKVLQDIM